MTRLLFSGHEGGDSHIEPGSMTITTATNGTITYDTGTHRAGNYALKALINNGAGDIAFVDFNFAGATARTYFMRCYINVATFPAANTGVDIMFFVNAAVADICSVRLKTDKKLYLHDVINNADIGVGSAALVADTWYRVELAVKINSSTNDDYAELMLDGTSIASSTNRNFGTSAPAQAEYGIEKTGGVNDICTIYFDDFALNDSQGSVNNTWCSAGNIILMLPASDNARGANWVGGAGGTTNLFDAVNNLPPVGKALASGTNSTQVKNVTSDTTGNLDINLETFFSRGYSPASFTCCQGVWDLGCDNATSTSGATLVLSNPAEVAETSINFSSGAIAGTWSSNWKRQFNTIIENPVIDTSTPTVLRLGKRQATTRAGMCDLMGLSVEYLPATTLIFNDRFMRFQPLNVR